MIDVDGNVQELNALAAEVKTPYTMNVREDEAKSRFQVGFRKIWLRDSSRDLQHARRNGPARTLISVKRPKSASPITLLVNRWVESRAEAIELARAYIQRWTVEEGIRRLKDDRGFGFAVESTALARKFCAQRRLLLFVTMLCVFLASLALLRTEAARVLCLASRSAGAVPRDCLYRLTEVIGRKLGRAPRWTVRRWFGN